MVIQSRSLVDWFDFSIATGLTLIFNLPSSYELLEVRSPNSSSLILWTSGIFFCISTMLTCPKPSLRKDDVHKSTAMPLAHLDAVVSHKGLFPSNRCRWEQYLQWLYSSPGKFHNCLRLSRRQFKHRNFEPDRRRWGWRPVKGLTGLYWVWVYSLSHYWYHCSELCRLLPLVRSYRLRLN